MEFTTHTHLPYENFPQHSQQKIPWGKGGGSDTAPFRLIMSDLAKKDERRFTFFWTEVSRERTNLLFTKPKTS